MWPKDNRVDEFWLIATGNRVRRRVGQFSLLQQSASVHTPIEYHSRVLYHARNVASFPTRCTTVAFGQVFRIMAWRPMAACSTLGVPHSTTWGAQPSYSVGRVLMIDCWGLTSEQQYFSYIQTMNMKWMMFVCLLGFNVRAAIFQPPARILSTI